MTVGQRRASAQMHIAVALRDRLPRVAALYLRGVLSSRVVSTITWRTRLVADGEALALIDAALAAGADRWGPLSEDRLDEAIDAWVVRFDPAGVRRSESSARDRDVVIGDCDDPAETTAVWGRLTAADAAVLKQRLAQVVGTVCGDDPRSMGERRSDALGAIGAGVFHLVCQCGSERCPAGAAPRSSSVVIRVLADHAAIDAATKLARPTPADTATDSDEPASVVVGPRPAVIVGGDLVSTPLLAQLIRSGARVAPLTMPGVEPEPRYRPSARLAEFVRLRDLYCRAPGCGVSADRCDIDHTIPYPVGSTHASNLKCVCRTHHLMKTFGGWRDIQLPDGTVVWISPTGRKYITAPGSRLFFDTWDTTTANLPPPPAVCAPADGRALMMPRRRRTRAAEEAARIKAERARNDEPAPF
jgi:hypothetical protein